MTNRPDDAALGGRLPLLHTHQLQPDQREIRDLIMATRGERARSAGYLTTTPDGSMIGPFNALLRVPDIATAQLRWAQAISRGGLDERVTESVILTVAALCRSDYISYAHRIAGRSAGLPDATIDAIRSGGELVGAPRSVDLAVRVTRQLVRQHTLDDTLYAEALEQFSETGLVTLTVLIGQYLTTSVVLACFRVPAP